MAVATESSANATAAEAAKTALMSDRRLLFPAFDPSWVLHHDSELLIVDKPAGVPTQAADPEHRDDLPFRLEQWLATHARDPYVGIHQRLDAATSGVVFYTRSRDANRPMAHQMEGRTVTKVYVAAVFMDEWLRGPTTLRDALIRDGERSRVVHGSFDGGESFVGSRPSAPRSAHRSRDKRGPRGSHRRDPKSRMAVSHVRLLEQRGTRALVEVRIETGRTHQIRAQLSYRGVAIAGDALYGGPPAPRLMLHASRLGFDHPATGERLDIQAPTPAIFERWLEGEDWVSLRDPAALREALQRAMQSRWGLGRAALSSAPTTAFRLLNGRGDGVPGLRVDVYGSHLVAHLYGENAVEAQAQILDALDSLGWAGIYVKQHPKQKNRLGADEQRALAPTEPLRGSAAVEPLVIYEDGVAYATALGDGLSTGIFLDQRDARQRIRRSTSGKRVLNLFAYAGAFGVAAAVGGARKVVDVDVSRPALARASQSQALNEVSTERRQEDAFEFLARAAARSERFDLVIADPPSYSTSSKRRWTSGKDWVELAAGCFAVLAPQGVLYASSNDGRMTLAALRRHIHEGARRAGVSIAQMKELPTPRDFPAAKLHRLWIQEGPQRLQKGQRKQPVKGPRHPAAVRRKRSGKGPWKKKRRS